MILEWEIEMSVDKIIIFYSMKLFREFPLISNFYEYKFE